MSRLIRIIVESNSSNARKLDLSERIIFSRESEFIKESDFVEENVLIVSRECCENLRLENHDDFIKFFYSEPPYIAILVSIDGKNHTYLQN